MACMRSSAWCARSKGLRLAVGCFWHHEHANSDTGSLMVDSSSPKEELAAYSTKHSYACRLVAS